MPEVAIDLEKEKLFLKHVRVVELAPTDKNTKSFVFHLPAGEVRTSRDAPIMAWILTFARQIWGDAHLKQAAIFSLTASSSELGRLDGHREIEWLPQKGNSVSIRRSFDSWLRSHTSLLRAAAV